MLGLIRPSPKHQTVVVVCQGCVLYVCMTCVGIQCAFPI